MIPLDEDFPTLCRIREVLENFWSCCDPVKKNPAGAGMCGITSVFLLKLLNDRGETGWELACGVNQVYCGEEIYPQNVGFFDGRNWHSHIWLQKDNRILDLAASQFGGPEIIAGKIDDRYRGHILSGGLSNSIVVPMIATANAWYQEWQDISRAYGIPNMRKTDFEKLELGSV